MTIKLRSIRKDILFRLMMPGEGTRYAFWRPLFDNEPLASYAKYEVALPGIFSCWAIGNTRRVIENQSEGHGARIAGTLYKPGDETNPLLESHGIETIFS